MSKPVSNLRLFVAVYPPEGVMRAMLRPLRKIDGLPAHRATLPEQVHLTLQFIGDTPAKEMDDVQESIARSISGIDPFTLTPARLVALPERGHFARLLAVETDAPPGLLEIQRRLALRLSQRVRRKPGDRFRPHFTICRFSGGGKRIDRERIERDLDIESFEVRELHLMRSRLDPRGVEHKPVQVFPLGPVT